MPCPIADMDSCLKKCKCVGGACNGAAYNCEDPCGPGFDFDSARCECISLYPPGLYEWRYYDWEETYALECPSGAFSPPPTFVGGTPPGDPLGPIIFSFETYIPPVLVIQATELEAVKNCDGSFQNLPLTTVAELSYQPVDGGSIATATVTASTSSMSFGSPRKVFFKFQNVGLFRVGDNT